MSQLFLLGLQKKEKTTESCKEEDGIEAGVPRPADYGLLIAASGQRRLYFRTLIMNLLIKYLANLTSLHTCVLEHMQICTENHVHSMIINANYNNSSQRTFLKQNHTITHTGSNFDDFFITATVLPRQSDRCQKNCILATQHIKRERKIMNLECQKGKFQPA